MLRLLLLSAIVAVNAVNQCTYYSMLTQPWAKGLLAHKQCQDLLIEEVQGQVPQITKFCECVRYGKQTLPAYQTEMSCTPFPNDGVWGSITLWSAFKQDCSGFHPPLGEKPSKTSVHVYHLTKNNQDADEALLTGAVKASGNTVRVSNEYLAGIQFRDVDVSLLEDEIYGAWMGLNIFHPAPPTPVVVIGGGGNSTNSTNTTAPTSAPVAPTPLVDSEVILSLEDNPGAVPYSSSVTNDINNRVMNKNAMSSFTAQVGEEKVFTDVTLQVDTMVSHPQWSIKGKMNNINFILDHKLGSAVEFGAFESGMGPILVIQLSRVETEVPTAAPSVDPTPMPTNMPSVDPTPAPSPMPTKTPTMSPTKTPTSSPTKSPTSVPTGFPTTVPTKAPTTVPTGTPTQSPTDPPTTVPTGSPTQSPTDPPTQAPSPSPTNMPSPSPTMPPSPSPTKMPTPSPTMPPSPSPTKKPSPSPTMPPTKPPTSPPTAPPTMTPAPTPAPSTSGGLPSSWSQCSDLNFDKSWCDLDPFCGWDQSVPECNLCLGTQDDCKPVKKICLQEMADLGQKRDKQNLALCIIGKSVLDEASECCDRYVCATSGNCKLPPSVPPTPAPLTPTPKPTLTCAATIGDISDLADCNAAKRSCEKQLKRAGYKKPYPATNLFNCVGNWATNPANNPTKCCAQYVCHTDAAFCGTIPTSMPSPKAPTCTNLSTDCNAERRRCRQHFAAQNLAFTPTTLAECIMVAVAADNNVSPCCSDFVCANGNVCKGDNYTYPPTMGSGPILTNPPTPMPSTPPTPAPTYWTYNDFNTNFCNTFTNKKSCQANLCQFNKKNGCQAGPPKKVTCEMIGIWCTFVEGCTFDLATFNCIGTPSICFTSPNSNQCQNDIASGKSKPGRR